MKVLLDTHTFLWVITADARLSKTAQITFLDPENLLYFSIVSLWEIGIKQGLKKISLKKGWLETFQEEMHANTIQWLPLEIEHCAKVVELPFHHRDPFDRMLVAQSMIEDLTILTSNTHIAMYGIRCIW